MTNELKQAVNKIVELSETSTLCGQYSNSVISISFKIDSELIITEQTTGDGFSLWCHNDCINTPTEININYVDIESFEFISEHEMNMKSNGECNIASLEMKLVDGSKLVLFEDVA